MKIGAMVYFRVEEPMDYHDGLVSRSLSEQQVGCNEGCKVEMFKMWVAPKKRAMCFIPSIIWWITEHPETMISGEHIFQEMLRFRQDKEIQALWDLN